MFYQEFLHRTGTMKYYDLQLLQNHLGSHFSLFQRHETTGDSSEFKTEWVKLKNSPYLIWRSVPSKTHIRIPDMDGRIYMIVTENKLQSLDKTFGGDLESQHQSEQDISL